MKEKHQELVSNDSSAEKSQDFYRQTRTILLGLLQCSPYLKDLQKTYENATQDIVQSDAMWYAYVPQIFEMSITENTPSLVVKEILEKNNKELLAFAIAYRQQAKVRFFHEKIQQKIREESTLSGLSDEMIGKLSRVSWLHGTKSSTLEAIKNTQNRFLPTGHLTKKGIVPHTGELREGSSLLGVNQKKLSGVDPRHVARAKRYAENYQFDIESEKGCLDAFLQFSPPKSNPIDDTSIAYGSIVRNITAIKRYRQWNPDDYEAHYKDKLNRKLNELETQLKDWIQTNPIELRSPTSHYHANLEEYETFLQSLKKVLSEEMPALSEEEKETIRNAYPLVIGSNNVISYPDFYWEEFGIRGGATLGEEIQYLFVPDEKVDEMEQTVHERDDVEVFSFTQLEQLHKIGQCIAPYLFDVLSSKKLAKLSAP